MGEPQRPSSRCGSNHQQKALRHYMKVKHIRRRIPSTGSSQNLSSSKRANPNKRKRINLPFYPTQFEIIDKEGLLTRVRAPGLTAADKSFRNRILPATPIERGLYRHLDFQTIDLGQLTNRSRGGGGSPESHFGTHFHSQHRTSV